MLKFVFVVLCLIIAVQSICLPYNGVTGLGYIKLCDSNKQNCKSVSSLKRTCINLVSGPFYYGNSENTAYQCIVYSNQNCGGSTFIVGPTQTRFPWRGLSFRCPYRC